MSIETQILNHKGDARIVLNDREAAMVNYNQEIINSLGYEINITSLTAIAKRVTEQKFFELAPSEYMPVAVGNGAWSSNIVTYLDFSTGSDFESCVVNTASSNSKIAEANAAIDSITVPVSNYTQLTSYSILELQMASRSGNWSLVTSKEKARKKTWDLGTQRMAFLGSNINTAQKGLLNQSSVTINTTRITKYISAMTDAEFQAFVAGVIADYRVNANYTARPSMFVIPDNDFSGLITPANTSFAITSKLEYLQKAFAMATMNPNFKILPCAYADKLNPENIAAGLSANCYALYNYEEESLRMDIPVPYTATLANSINGIQFQSGAYGQFTTLQAYRPLEMLYYRF